MKESSVEALDAGQVADPDERLDRGPVEVVQAGAIDEDEALHQLRMIEGQPRGDRQDRGDRGDRAGGDLVQPWSRCARSPDAGNYAGVLDALLGVVAGAVMAARAFVASGDLVGHCVDGALWCGQLDRTGIVQRARRDAVSSGRLCDHRQ